MEVFKAVAAIHGSVPLHVYQPSAEAALCFTDSFLLSSILACQGDKVQACSVYQNQLTVNISCIEKKGKKGFHGSLTSQDIISIP